MENNKKIEDELNFMALLKNPIRLFGLVYPYFLVLGVIVGIYYLQSLDTISFNEAPRVLHDSADVRRTVEMEKGGIVPAIDLAKLKNPEGQLDKGKELYNQTCASCHGEDGKGKGPAGAALNPAPRNFHATEGWTNGRELPQMYKTLQEGIIKNGMAAYEYMPVEDRVAIIHYVRTFGEYPEITDAQIQELDQTYKLSEGEVKPNTIPVDLAVKKYIEENGASTKNIDGYVKKAGEQSDNSIYNQYVNDGKKVFSLFAKERNMSFEEFKTIISNTPVEAGFNGKVVRLDEENLQKLYSFINGVMNTKEV